MKLPAALKFSSARSADDADVHDDAVADGERLLLIVAGTEPV